MTAQIASDAPAISQNRIDIETDHLRRTRRCVIWAAADRRSIPACRPISRRVCPDLGPIVAGAPCRLWRIADLRWAARGKGLNCSSGQLHSLRDLAHGDLGDSVAVGFTCSFINTVFSRSSGGTRTTSRLVALPASANSTPGATVSGVFVVVLAVVAPRGSRPRAPKRRRVDSRCVPRRKNSVGADEILRSRRSPAAADRCPAW